MKFVLEVDMSGMCDDEEAGKELGRILRYWGGTMRDIDVKAGQGQDVYDSAYRLVGRWEISDTAVG